jgi:hypothetical protein
MESGEHLAGVYTAFDPDAVYALHDSPVVVFGASGDAHRAATTLQCRRVIRAHPGRMELVAAAGIDRVECVLMRRIRSGRVVAVRADALFIL